MIKLARATRALFRNAPRTPDERQIEIDRVEWFRASASAANVVTRTSRRQVTDIDRGPKRPTRAPDTVTPLTLLTR